MYGGGGGSGDLRKQEQARQARIKSGLARINATFDGTRGVNPAAAYTPGAVYYDEFGQVWNPEPEGGKYPVLPGAPANLTSRGRWDRPGETRGVREEHAQPGSRPMTRDEWLATQFTPGKLFTGTAREGGFDDAFYARREQDYVGAVQPQFETQLADTRNNLAYSLARKGLSSSSAAVNRTAGLERYAGQKRREIADAAAGSANELRRDVENQRSALVSQLEASGDADATAQLALSQARAYRAPTAIGPVGSFFEDWTRNYVANQVARTYDPNVPQLFNYGQTGGGSMKTVRG